MKPLKPAPARRRDVVTHRARISSPSRTLTLASLALLVASALVSSADATRTNLEGVGAVAPRVLPASVNAPGPRVSPAVPTALTAKAALAPPPAAPFFQLPLAESIQTFAADCTTPKTSFNLGEAVCAKVANAAINTYTFYAGPVWVRKFSWINPAGLEVRATNIASSAQADTFTLPADETTTFGDKVVDNRGGWRVNISSYSDSSEITSAHFTVSKPGSAAADLGVLVTQEQRSQNVAAGAQASYLIFVDNRGPDAAANVQLTNPVPNHSTFLSLTQLSGPTFTCANPDVGTGPSGSSVCSAASLDSGARAEFLAVYLVGGGTDPETEIADTATATTTTTERNADDNTGSASYTVAEPSPCTITTPDDIEVDNEVVNGAALGGATVTYNAPTLGAGCGAVTCTPPSGAFFPVGTTFVTCVEAAPSSGENAGASTTAGQIARFSVTVNDTEAPTVTCPAPITVAEDAPNAGAVVNFSPTATDNGPVTVASNPPSGSTFPVGTTTVHVTATDTGGNTATCDFTVTVTSTACALDCPDDITVVEDTPGAGANVNFPAAVAIGAGCGTTINYSHPSGSNFALGTTVVTATDPDSGASCSFSVTVTDAPDTEPPTVSCPPNIEQPVPANSCSASLSVGQATATDNRPGVTVVGVRSDGAQLADPYPAGETIITWTATDAAGNEAACEQSVKLIENTPPSVSAPAPRSAVVNESCEVEVPNFTAGLVVSDNCTPNAFLEIMQSPGPETLVGVGSHLITITVTDASGNSQSVTTTFNVSDQIQPTISCPADIVVMLPPNTPDVSMPVGFAVTAADNCDAAPDVTFNHPPGSLFPVGTTVVTATATDASGNSASCTFNVTVLYNFAGFFAPVDNPPTLNQVNAGRAVPVKFSLSGNKGLAIFADGYPASHVVSCGTAAPVDLEETVTAGDSSLSYDASTDLYVYVWKTENSWKNTCRQLVIKLNDGSTYTALFKFK